MLFTIKGAIDKSIKKITIFFEKISKNHLFFPIKSNIIKIHFDLIEKE